MQKPITTFLLCLLMAVVSAQTPRKTSLYLEGQYNKTLSDVTRGNNPWGIGLGLQLFLRQTSLITPTIEITTDSYLMNDKVYRAYLDGTPIGTVRSMVNIFAGASVHPTANTYISFLAGPSFVGGQTLLGLKPSLGFYFSANQKLTAKISYINVLKREERAKQNFTSISFSLGARLN